MKKIILLLILNLTVVFAHNPFVHLEGFDSKSSNNKLIKDFNHVSFFANKGNSNAQFDLALMYLSGEGVKKDEKMAFKWIHKSARNNHLEAKFNMGLNFLYGRGVLKRKSLASYWFKLASKGGHLKARKFLAKM